MTKILMFGGTTEGRQIAEFCDDNKIEIYVSITSEYGDKLLPNSEYIHTLVGRMDENDMRKFITDHDISCVIDATHPYAVEVTKNIKNASCNVELYRVIRQINEYENEDSCNNTEDIIYFENVNEVVNYLQSHEGNVFVTTGSKELAKFTDVVNYEERMTVRVLDSKEIVEECLRIGFDKNRIISKRGPFTYDENILQIKNSSAKYLVTKCSGKTGGFDDKIKAAVDLSVTVLAIKPVKESGYTVAQINDILLDMR